MHCWTFDHALLHLLHWLHYWVFDRAGDPAG
jgi:hypothetical protein